MVKDSIYHNDLFILYFNIDNPFNLQYISCIVDTNFKKYFSFLKLKIFLNWKFGYLLYFHWIEGYSSEYVCAMSRSRKKADALNCQMW